MGIGVVARGRAGVVLFALVVGGLLGAAAMRAAPAPVGRPAPPATVRGRVVAPDGAPAAGVVLTLTDPAGVEVGSTATGEDGTCEFAVPRPGRYTLIAACPGRRPLARRLDTPEFTLVLPGGGAVGGFVRDEHDQAPIADAVVVLAAGSGRLLGARVTDPTGYYAFEDVPAGRYVVAVDHPGHHPLALDVAVAQGETAALDAELVDARCVRGAVLDRAGRPVGHAKVVLTDASGVTRTVVSGPTGEYRFDDLLRGDYLIGVRGGPTAPVRVEAADHERDLRL
ncbi:MSCRAMM family protein [Saccharothrix australiensis]|nr:carboxypeptidase-like regulatory domain-containing protein [Saccharothrix australiensis]